jgi:hypothetical protein
LRVSHIFSLCLHGSDLNKYTFIVCVFVFFEMCCNLHACFRVIIRMLMCLFIYFWEKSNLYLFTFWEIICTEILDAVLKMPDALIFIVVYKILSVHGVGLSPFIQLHGVLPFCRLRKSWLYWQFSTTHRYGHQIYFCIGPKGFMNLYLTWRG